MRIYTLIKKVSNSDVLPGVVHNQSGLKEERRTEEGVNLFNNSRRASLRQFCYITGAKGYNIYGPCAGM
jgi:hypothetical protein